MPQQFRVLRCFKCRICQVDIVKIAKKWACKMCGEKQSVLVEIFRGPAVECRRRVQALNMDERSEQQQGQVVSERILNGEIELTSSRGSSLCDNEENVTPPFVGSKYDRFKNVSPNVESTTERLAQISSDEENLTPVARSKYDCFKSFDSAPNENTTPDQIEFKREITPDDEVFHEHKRPKLSLCPNDPKTDPSNSTSKWTKFLD